MPSSNVSDSGEMLHLRLRDRSNCDFTVYAYYTCFRSVTGDSRYIVGLSEPECRAPIMPSSLRFQVPDPEPERYDSDQQVQPMSSRLSSSHSTRSESKEAYLNVSADLTSFPLTSASESFFRMFSVQNLNLDTLADVLDADAVLMLRYWLTDALNRVAARDLGLPHTHKFAPIQMTKLSGGSTTPVRMYAHLPCEGLPINEDDIQEYLLSGSYVFRLHFFVDKRAGSRARPLNGGHLCSASARCFSPMANAIMAL